MSSKTKQVSPRITMRSAAMIEEDYKSLSHGSAEACRGWPLARRAVLKTLKFKIKFTVKERKALYGLVLPEDCDRDDLVELLDMYGISCVGRIKALEEVQCVVLIDLLRNKELELVGRQMNGDGELT